MVETGYSEQNNDFSPASDAEEMWIYPDRLRKFLEFAKISHEALAKKSGTPISTVRKLLQGETRDPRASTLVPLLKACGADANVVLGLTPARDYDKDLSREGTLLADALRNQIDRMQAQIEEDDRRLVRLREMVLEKGEAKAVAESRVQSLEYMMSKRDETIRQQIETIAQTECRLEAKRNKIEELTAAVSCYKTSAEATETQLAALRSSRERRNKTYHRMAVALCISVALTIAVGTYFIFEITHIDKGLTGMQLEAYLEEQLNNPDEP